MIQAIQRAIARRNLAGALMLGFAGLSGAAQAATYTMYRDSNCGCCEQWAAHAREGLNAAIKVVDAANMAAVKAKYRVPAALQSCHTAIVGGYVIEGHVPAADIARLLKARPDGVTGLAVAGMPMGSPGMEHGSHRQAYKVIAFGPGGQKIFASYGAKR